MSSFFLDQATAKRYTVGVPFTYGDMNYTKAGATPETFKDLGFVEVTVDPRPDSRFYVVNSNPKDDGSWDAQPLELSELKQRFVAEQKTMEGSLLSSSDWMVIRRQETGKEIPAEWETYRQAVRDAGDARVSKIQAAKSIGKLKELIDGGLLPWPLDPDAQAEEGNS